MMIELRGHWLLCIAILAFFVAPALSQVAASPTRVDPQSGVAFPVAFTPPGSAVPHQLTGTARREFTVYKG